MQLTIIPIDGAVYRDGVSVHHLNLEGIPAEIHALQWNGSDGWIEYNNGTPNENIDSLPAWADAAVILHTNSIKPVVKPNTNALSTIYATYPVANQQSINKLLNTQFTNLVLSPRVRESDGATIGVQVQRVYGEDTGTGASGLLSIKDATAEAVKLGIPLISDAYLPEDKRQGFKSFLESFGHSVIEDNGVLYLYYPWSLDLAKARKNTFINTDRDKEINKGVLFLGSIWDIDQVSKTNLISKAYALDSGLDTSTAIEWRTKDNEVLTLSVDEFKQLVALVVTTTEDIYKTSWDRKDDVANASTYEEVEAA